MVLVTEPHGDCHKKLWPLTPHEVTSENVSGLLVAPESFWPFPPNGQLVCQSLMALVCVLMAAWWSLGKPLPSTADQVEMPTTWTIGALLDAVDMPSNFFKVFWQDPTSNFLVFWQDPTSNFFQGLLARPNFFQGLLARPNFFQGLLARPYPTSEKMKTRRSSS